MVKTSRSCKIEPGVCRMADLQEGEMGEIIKGGYKGRVVMRLAGDPIFAEVFRPSEDNCGCPSLSYFDSQAAPHHMVRKLTVGEFVTITVVK